LSGGVANHKSQRSRGTSWVKSLAGSAPALKQTPAQSGREPIRAVACVSQEANAIAGSNRTTSSRISWRDRESQPMVFIVVASC
jgi:hypothetical protein